MRIRKPVDPVKQFRDWMKNTLRRAFFRFWERTKAIQAARVDRGLYKCAMCLVVSKIEGHHIDHINPVVDPKVGFVGWDTYIERLFCPSSNLQLLCKACHTIKTDKEREERKLYKTGVFKLGRITPEDVKQKLSESHKGKIPLNLADIQRKRRRCVVAENIVTGEQKEFSSITEAGQALNVSIGNIATVCKGNSTRTQTGGWDFKYRENKNGLSSH
jgi:hypothetical protein